MSFVDNNKATQERTRLGIEKGTVLWRSASVQLAAYTMVWSIVAAGGIESV